MDLDKVQVGLRIKTNAVLGKTTGMIVAARHLRARRPSTEGVIDDFVPGHGGDVWFIRHGSEFGAYCYNEFELVREEKSNDDNRMG